MRRVLAVAVAVVFLTGLVMFPGALILFAGGTSTASAAVPCAPEGLAVDPEQVNTELDGTQLRNIATIVGTGVRLGVPEKGLVIAVAAAWVETGGVYNLPSRARLASLSVPHDTHPTAWAPSGIPPGDLDSVGLFQQRDAWGTISARMNPVMSTEMFFTGGAAGQRGLLDIPGWETLPVGRAAQAVQVSAFPARYAEQEAVARAAVAAVTNGTTVTEECAPEPVTTGGAWVLPMNPGYRLTSPYGYRTHPVTGVRKLHAGQDLAAPVGTPILAASAGSVTRAAPAGGFGNLIVLDHGDGTETYYAHLCPGCTTVGVGDTVTAGQRIGGVGTTGMSTGPHLHFEVRVGGVPTDPTPFMSQRGVTW